MIFEIDDYKRINCIHLYSIVVFIIFSNFFIVIKKYIKFYDFFLCMWGYLIMNSKSLYEISRYGIYLVYNLSWACICSYLD